MHRRHGGVVSTETDSPRAAARKANLATIAAVMAAAAGLSLYVSRARGTVRRTTAVLLALVALAASIKLIRDLNINVATYVAAVVLSPLIALLVHRDAPSDQVAVVDPGRFEVIDCVVQERPLVPATGTVRVYGLAAEGLDGVADGTVMELVAVDDALLHLRLQSRLVVVDRAAVTFEYVLGGKEIEMVSVKSPAPPP